LLLCLLSALGRASSQTVEGKQIHNADSSEANECAECHEEAVRGFARSRMAQSMRLPGRGPEGTVRVPGTTIHMYSNQKGTWQTLETQGHTETYRVSYVIGSGTHASGYLISLANHLFQSPVAYYKRRSAYGLAPGYENKPAPDFTRPVEPGCLFCHAGSFKAVSGTQNEYAAKPFEHLAIECSRCHGPVDAHLDDPSSSNIVNPARLEPAARDSICEQCHLKGVARVLNPGKEFTDFVAGQPLENTFTIYRYAMPEGEEPPFKVISQSEMHCGAEPVTIPTMSLQMLFRITAQNVFLVMPERILRPSTRPKAAIASGVICRKDKPMMADIRSSRITESSGSRMTSGQGSQSASYRGEIHLQNLQSETSESD
jgi:hypothetical protein